MSKCCKEMYLFPLHVAFLLLSLHTTPISSHSNIDFQVGVILDLDSPVGRIGNSCLSKALSDFYSHHRDYKTRLVLNVRDSNGSVVNTAASAFELLRDVKVDAIIGPQKSTQANFVMDLGDKARVPIISFSATCPCLIPRTPYFVQTAQSDANQVHAIASIIKAFKWNQVVIIYEDTDFGNGIIPYLSNALQDVNVKVPHRSVFPVSATDDFIYKELYKLMTMETRVFVVHTSQRLGTRLFLKSKELGMMSEGYAWIVTSGITDLFNLMDLDVVEAMQGVVGVKPLIPKAKHLQDFAATWIQKFSRANENLRTTELSIFGLWAYDSLWALAKAAERVGNSTGSNTQTNYDNVDSAGLFTLPISKTGPELLSALLETRFQGLAGDFKLVNGRLEQSPYQIVNIVGKYEREVGIWMRYGGISKELNLNVTGSYSTSGKNLRSIIWPGDSTRPPKGWEVPTNGKKLRVGVPQKPGFNEFLKVETDPETNATTVSGYFREVFDAVMAALPYAVPYEYVAYPFFSSDGLRIGCYDDLVYQVSLQEEYDAALGDITITANRSEYSDFSLPFAEGGVLGIVRINYENANDIWTFLQPLTPNLGLTIIFVYIVTGLAVWILGNRILSNSGEAPNPHPGLICYFPFFPGEGIDRTLLYVVLVVWALVASLLNATYTASLSSRLTVQSTQPTVTDLKQLIRNGDYVGCQEGSFLVTFLTKLGFDESRIKTYKSTEDCDEALTLGSKKGGISAYYDVLPHIRLILSQYCDKYTIVRPTHRTDGFAFAFLKNSPVVADVSRAIIQLTEHGKIHDIEQRFSTNLACSDSESTSSSLSRVTLRSFLVLLVFSGFVTIACLIVSCLRYLHKERAFLHFLHRATDLISSLGSSIHELQAYLKQIITLFHLKTRNTRT